MRLIVSTDARAQAQLNRMISDGTAEKVFAITHFACCEVQPSALLNWFKENRPDILSKTRYALAVKDFVRMKLTGKIASEITDMANNNLIDPVTRSVSSELYEIQNLSDLKYLFDYPVYSSEELAGQITKQASEITGIPEGTPVAAGFYDVTSCTVGTGAIKKNTIAVTGGTWAMSSYFTENLSGSESSTCATSSPFIGRYLLEQGSGIGTVNLNWYLFNFTSKIFPNYSKSELYGLCSKVINETDPEKIDIIFIPYLYSAPSNPNAKGAFFNLMGYHGHEEILFSILEGIIFGIMHHIRLLQIGAPSFEEAYLAGGIAASSEWSQMFCDVFGHNVIINKSKEQGALGCAICAGICAGLFDSFEEASKKMIHPEKILKPDLKKTEIYNRLFIRYEHALKALDFFYD